MEQLSGLPWEFTITKTARAEWAGMDHPQRQAASLLLSAPAILSLAWCTRATRLAILTFTWKVIVVTENVRRLSDSSWQGMTGHARLKKVS